MCSIWLIITQTAAYRFYHLLSAEIQCCRDPHLFVFIYTNIIVIPINNDWAIKSIFRDHTILHIIDEKRIEEHKGKNDKSVSKTLDEFLEGAR